jgi:HPt (histidine-containing phosphotransfer) domain-containing protein
MADYLSKPFTKQDLASLLKKHFPDLDLQINLDLNENMFQHSLSKIIEPRMLENLLEIESDNQPGFIFEILDIFSEHTKEKFTAIRQAIGGKNRPLIQTAAHNLKGSSANIGLTAISALFEDLEIKSDQADWIEIESVFEKAVETFKQIEKIILESKP